LKIQSFSNSFFSTRLYLQLMHEGRTAFSLDGGRTKFPSLEQLVEFHRMNSGPLPTLLADRHVEICPVGALVNIASWQKNDTPTNAAAAAAKMTTMFRDLRLYVLFKMAAAPCARVIHQVPMIQRRRYCRWWEHKIGKITQGPGHICFGEKNCQTLYYSAIYIYIYIYKYLLDLSRQIWPNHMDEKKKEKISLGALSYVQYMLPAFSQELYFLNMWLHKKKSFFPPPFPGWETTGQELAGPTERIAASFGE
jgi:hypothetical protein